ncbi:amidohydrolase [Sinomonas atrocyanea]|uniref:amidohydrolase family protein n=1 Tax=Sinomonas atrocyanea TaxID=37927 RepID=UPI002786CCC8|nr:amidohydrolase family protein [Sinomonas atrocyanea]MDQ0259508.1 putative TIM-barrel fold metal-dependent hydrolase [Sinomonas atrocyanea]MDR6623350.1 putative TIM-barrel fold metal-dependent hydrolase [Sinomonas atrocyanea]
MTLEVIDAHHHLCLLSAASYPWLEGQPQKRYHGDDLPLRRDYLLDDYLADAAGLAEIDARLVGSVHIENGAADPLWEAEWVDRVIAHGPFPTVQVVKVDLTAPDAHDQLAKHRDRASVRGVRDILNWHPDPYYSHRDRDDLLQDPDWLRGFRALGDLGLSFDLQVFPHQLADAARLAADHGSTPIVLDHAGMPIERDDNGLAEWAKGMRLLAAEPNTTVKISALGTNDHTWTTDSIRQIVLTTIDFFGPQRCMFGSNFPVDGLYSTYTDVFRAFDHITADLSQNERKRLFAGTAREFYRLGTAHPQADPAPTSIPSGGDYRG